MYYLLGLSPSHYIDIEARHVIFSYAGEDDMDWEEYIAETSNFEKLRNLLCGAHYDLVNTIEFPLFYKKHVHVKT